MDVNEVVRPALYYPYIHIRSESWLKATLLCVPTVKRIVPEGYIPEDDPVIEPYNVISGPHGTLLQTVPAYSPAADMAQRKLLDNLITHADAIEERYGRKHAPARDSYWIHEAKFNHRLLNYLREQNLAWRSPHSEAYGRRTWYALHPTLGKAIMTTLGLSIAHEQNYDIVTADGRYHEAFLATKEDSIFQTLLDGGQMTPEFTRVQARYDLGHLVITMAGINYRALLPEQIPELQVSPRFQSFQRLLRASAGTVDRNTDPVDYHRQLKEEAHNLIAAWQETRSDLSRDLQGVLFGGATLGVEILRSLIKGSSPVEIAVAGGLGIWQITMGISGLLDKREHSRHYLSDILQAQDPLLQLMYPLGL